MLWHTVRRLWKSGHAASICARLPLTLTDTAHPDAQCAAVAMIRFKVGGVYNARTEEDDMAGELGIPIKVTRISDGKIWIRAPDLVVDKNPDGDGSCPITLNGEGNEFNEFTCFLESYTERRYWHQDSDSEDEYLDERSFDATKLHVLHPWFPKTNDSRKASHFHKDIMKTSVLFFFSVKPIVLARRVKERMYTPGGLASSQHRRTLTVPPSRSALNDSHTPLTLLWLSAFCGLRRCGLGDYHHFSNRGEWGLMYQCRVCFIERRKVTGTPRK